MINLIAVIFKTISMSVEFSSVKLQLQRGEDLTILLHYLAIAYISMFFFCQVFCIFIPLQIICKYGAKELKFVNYVNVLFIFCSILFETYDSWKNYRSYS